MVAEETFGLAVISIIGNASQDPQCFGSVEFRQKGIEGPHKERQGFEYLMWNRSGSALTGDIARKLKDIQKGAWFSGDDIGFSGKPFSIARM